LEFGARLPKENPLPKIGSHVIKKAVCRFHLVNYFTRVSRNKFAARRAGKPAAKVTQTILGGGDAGLSSPYFVAVVAEANICGGALISDKIFLSAASCTET